MNAFKKYFLATLVAAMTLFGGFTASAQTNPIPTTASPNYTGMWCMNCDTQGGEAGWGMQLVDHGTNMFVVWYGYNQNEKPFWFTVSGGTFSPDKSTFTGALYVTTGPSYRLSAFDRNLVTIRQAGSMTLSWANDSTATLSYTVDGVTVVKSIKKYIFTNPPFTTWPSNNSDMWCNGCERLDGEAGWGMTIEQQGDQMFLAFFVYGDDGQPFWFTVSGGSWTTDKSFTGMLWTTTGPSYTNPFFDGSRVTIAPAGTATLLFKDRETATLTYTANCTTVTKEVNRYHFIPNEQIGGTMFKPSKLSAFVLAAGIAGCGGGGGGSTGPSPGPAAATVAITQVAPANGSTNVSVTEKPTLTFQVSNGSYLSHTADFRCGGNPVAHSSSVNSTAGTITLTPSSPASLVGQTCQINWTVNGTPSGNPGAQMTQVWSYAAVNIPPKLLALIQGDNQNGYVDIDIATFTGAQKNPGASFYAADYDASSQNIVLASPLSASTQPYSFVNVATGAVSAGLNLPYQNTQRTAVKCEPKGSSRLGLCYYGFGGNNDGRVVIASGRNVVETVALPDASLGRIPTQLAIIGDTLVVKTLSPFGTLDVLHRLNLAVTPRTWQSSISLPIKALGIDVRGNSVYVAGLTTLSQYKVVIADTITGSVQDLNLTLGYAGDVALSADTMFVSEIDKVKSYRLSDNAFLGDIALVGAEKLAYHNGYLFVSNSLGSVYKVNAATKAKEAEINVPQMRSGDLVVIAP